MCSKLNMQEKKHKKRLKREVQGQLKEEKGLCVAVPCAAVKTEPKNCEQEEQKMISIPFTAIEADIYSAIRKAVTERIKRAREKLPLTAKAHVSALLANIYFGAEHVVSLTPDEMANLLGSSTRKEFERGGYAIVQSNPPVLLRYDEKRTVVNVTFHIIVYNSFGTPQWPSAFRSSALEEEEPWQDSQGSQE